MGIAKGTIKLMMKEGLRRPLKGSILTLGRQFVWVTEKQLVQIANELNYPLVQGIESEYSTHPPLRERKCISDRFLFRSLGFTEVYSLDVSDYEAADFIGDLNDRALPAKIGRKFDFILDGGTIEHVFHVHNSLMNIHDLVQTGGRLMHLSPSSNHIDHGFYMFSPTLFIDYYKTNFHEVNTIQVIRYTQKHDTKDWEISNYIPGCLDRVSFGGLDDGMYAICCVATKTQDSVCHLIPQQRSYVEIWRGKEGKKLSGLRKILPQFIKLPLKKTLSLFSKKGLGLKVVDRL